MKTLGATTPSITHLQTNWGEKAARFLTDPTVSGLLLSIGMLGVMIAFYTRTLGPFTAAGIVALALFFGGHAIVQLVGWEEAILFFIGLVLMALEIFVIPGLASQVCSGLLRWRPRW
ncbi:MAG: hypothetical protein R3A47_02380 [Polyangiales bacterium]